ncbi:MAG: FAD-dependent oxidoreductase, partial [Pseudomonadota bacterium]
LRPWQPRLAVIDSSGIAPKPESPQRYVGVPGMNEVCRHLARRVEHRLQWRVERLWPCEGGWALGNSDGEEQRARRVLVTAPPEQTVALLEGVPGVTCPDALRSVCMRPCWALMAQFDQSLLDDYDAAFVNDGPISWVSSQRSRGERPAADAWVIHASPDWSEAHLERDPEWVAATLLEHALSLAGARGSLQVQRALAHRWRYAIAASPLAAGAVSVAGNALVAAGDWACGSRVEGAWLSGRAAARALSAD